MKKSLFLFFFFATILLNLKGQTTLDKSKIDALRREAEFTRRDSLAMELGLTSSETLNFWPLYDSYRKDIVTINTESVGLILEIIEHYNDISDERAQKINERVLFLDSKKVSLRDSYIVKFTKFISPRKVTKFYILERILDNRLSTKIVDAIRLVEPLPYNHE